MSFKINEALLEMHFYEHLRKFYKEKYNLNVSNIYKPSAQNEAWLGFDSAWIQSEYSEDELKKRLIEHIFDKNTFEEKKFIGFFMQFKIVNKVSRKSKNIPSGYSTPYYRSKLTTKVNPRTNISQHSILKKLCTIPNADVSYACAMVFNREDLELANDISKLRIIPVNGSPEYENDTSTHYITFKDINDCCPQYNSEPIIVESFKVDDWLQKNFENSNTKSVLEILEKAKAIHKDHISDNIDELVKRLELGKERKRLKMVNNTGLLKKNDDRVYFDRIYSTVDDDLHRKLIPFNRHYSCLTIIEFE